MVLFDVILIIATFLCSLVAGFLFAFAVVVMPGIRKLNDRDYLRAFQVIDGVIQDNQPVFIIVWIGSFIALVAAVLAGFKQLDIVGRVLLSLATFFYIFGVQVPTITINVPLNNRLKTLEVDSMNEADSKSARDEFEPHWNRWNIIRTYLACFVSVLSIILLIKL